MNESSGYNPLKFLLVMSEYDVLCEHGSYDSQTLGPGMALLRGKAFGVRFYNQDFHKINLVKTQELREF
jgi:hypothetical protein